MKDMQSSFALCVGWETCVQAIQTCLSNIVKEIEEDNENKSWLMVNIDIGMFFIINSISGRLALGTEKIFTTSVTRETMLAS